MAKEYDRTQRVADYLQRELAELIQHEVRDPRLGMVSVTGVEVSRDLAYARVYYTVMGTESPEDAAESTEVLNKAAGFLRSKLSRDSNMRSVPQLQGSAACRRGWWELARAAANARGALGMPARWPPRYEKSHQPAFAVRVRVE